jgi:hypothetical protein
MQLRKFLSADVSTALEKSRLLPVKTYQDDCPVICFNCGFVNEKDHNFCTNCGYPVRPNDERLALYHFRQQKRKSLQHNCMVKIEHARNALYVIASFSMLGIFYVFSNVDQKAITGLVMVFLGIIYAGLGRWSLQKPFTSLLISLIIVVTFTAINTWAEISSKFTTRGGIYLFIIQIILIYFLLQGVKSAFHADILEEEFKL